MILIGGKPDFNDLTFSISGTVFTYGTFLNLLIAFLVSLAYFGSSGSSGGGGGGQAAVVTVDGVQLFEYFVDGRAKPRL